MDREIVELVNENDSIVQSTFHETNGVIGRGSARAAYHREALSRVPWTLFIVHVVFVLLTS